MNDFESKYFHLKTPTERISFDRILINSRCKVLDWILLMALRWLVIKSWSKSKIVSENIKWNQKIKSKKIKALLINTRNANAFTGKDGLKGIKLLSEELSDQLNEKQI